MRDPAASFEGEHALAAVDCHWELLPDCVLSQLICTHVDARGFCALSLCCSAMKLLCKLGEEEFFEGLVHRCFGPIEWAVPNAFRPGRCSWRSHFFQLSIPGQETSWSVLACKQLTHRSLMARGLLGAGPSGHENAADCLLVIDGTVYDVTAFAHLHPGMAASLHLFAGSDATKAFRDVSHSPQVPPGLPRLSHGT